MGFIRRFCTAAAAIIFTFVLAIQAFAVSIDGSVSPDEVRGTNVQIQCENENGGNGICALATYYTKTEKGSLYVAINGDISYADLTKESPVVYEIYVDGKGPIKISITGNAEYDEQFSVKSSASLAGGGITCEALIDRKYSFGGDPEIYVRVTDDKGVPSKMFEIDTYIAPPDTTAEQNNQSGNSDSDDRDTTKTTKKSSSTKSTTKKESTTKKKSKSSSSKSSTKSKTKNKTTKSNSSKNNRSSKSQDADEEYLIDNADEMEIYTLPSDGNTRNAARVKQGVTAVGITVIIATVISISLLIFKKSGKK